MQAKWPKFFLWYFLICFSVHAEEVLCTITSDIDSSKALLTYELDQDSRSITHLYQETFENNQMVAKDEMDLSKLTKGGIVLLERSNYVIVRIWSDNFDRDQGGVLNIDTLYNGISGERRQYDIDLARKDSGFDLAHDKTEFKNMKFIAKRSKILGIIGIEKVVFSK